MKKIRLLTMLSAFTLAAAGALGLANAKNRKGAQPALADDSGYLYYAVESSTLSNYTAKLNLNIGDNNTWRSFEFEPTKYTYTSGNKEYYILKADYSVKYGGVDTMQIQLYNGGSWVSQQQPYSSWTPMSTFDQKMYVHDVGWVSFSHNDVKTGTVYVDAFNWSNLYIYTFEYIGSKKIETNGGWPGKKVTVSDSNLKFNGGMLQKTTFEYVNSSKAQFIYHDNSSNQSSDMAYSEGRYYWHNGSAWTSDATYGQAAAFVYDLNTTRLAVGASGSIKAFSICGLTASTWVNRYNSLSSTARGYVDSASIYTYKNQSSTGADTTVTFDSVMTQLSLMAGSSSQSRVLGQNLTDSTKTIVVIALVSLVSLTAIGGFFFIRKRKYN